MPTHDFRVLRLRSVTSTQDVLRSRVRSGIDVTGACVRALEQTKGRGRRGTLWNSSRGGSYQSAGLGRETFPWLTLALGVGIAELLAEDIAAGVSVKWPNDLYLDGRKLGGILVEVVSGQVVVGVGVNVRNSVPPGASAIASATPNHVSDLVLEGLQRGLALARSGGEAVRDRFSAVDHLRGRGVVVNRADDAASPPVSGIASGIDALGALLVAPEGEGTELARVSTGHVTRWD